MATPLVLPTEGGQDTEEDQPCEYQDNSFPLHHVRGYGGCSLSF